MFQILTFFRIPYKNLLLFSYFSFLVWRDSPQRVMTSSFLRFLDHTQQRNTVGRTPLDEWSARSRDLHLTIHNTQNTQNSMPPVGFEPTTPAGERPQTYALDRAPTGTGLLISYFLICTIKIINFRQSRSKWTVGRSVLHHLSFIFLLKKCQFCIIHFGCCGHKPSNRDAYYYAPPTHTHTHTPISNSFLMLNKMPWGPVIPPTGKPQITGSRLRQCHMVCTLASIAAEWRYYITFTLTGTPVSPLNYSRQLKLSSDSGVYSATYIAVTEKQCVLGRIDRLAWRCDRPRAL